MKIKNIDTAVIEDLNKKDYEKFQAKENSFQLYSWVRDELILCKYFKYTAWSIEAKALARVLNILASLREKNLLTQCDIQIKDTKTAVLTFDVDFSVIENRERRRLNTDYSKLGVNFEELVDVEPDQTYDHMF
jgi:hypothetical protein